MVAYINNKNPDPVYPDDDGLDWWVILIIIAGVIAVVGLAVFLIMKWRNMRNNQLRHPMI